jgi:hypothetical protein
MDGSYSIYGVICLRMMGYFERSVARERRVYCDWFYIID